MTTMLSFMVLLIVFHRFATQRLYKRHLDQGLEILLCFWLALIVLGVMHRISLPYERLEFSINANKEWSFPVAAYLLAYTMSFALARYYHLGRSRVWAMGSGVHLGVALLAAAFGFHSFAIPIYKASLDYPAGYEQKFHNLLTILLFVSGLIAIGSAVRSHKKSVQSDRL
jgi:hypothetical protein